MKYLTLISYFALLILIFLEGCRGKSDGPYFATGIKIGEVTDEEAIIWIRLTSDSLPAPFGSPAPEIVYKDPVSGELTNTLQSDRDEYVPVVLFPLDDNTSVLEGGTTGVEGDFMVYYKPKDSLRWEHTDWISVNPARDYTAQILLQELVPGTEYDIKIVSRYPNSTFIGEFITGQFKTAPAAGQERDVLFTVTTGQAYDDQDAAEGGFKIYHAMLKLDIDFFVHTGDILYYDDLAKNESLARWHWSRTYSLPTNYGFHRYVSSYFMKDDHDTWINDCWPGYETKFMGEFTFNQGQAIFLEQVPMGARTYRTFRWGKDLQIWLVEGRDFRSPNTDPDGPAKSIWGITQKAWFYKTVEASDATFKILISPTPIVGPDRLNKHDNHSNKDFAFEGNELRKFIAGQKNMYVVCGDRHWQYISVDDETGVREYSCGPASNEHAGGWNKDQKMAEHVYLNVTGGFLAGQLKHNKEETTLIFSHYSVEGEMLNSDTLKVR